MIKCTSGKLSKRQKSKKYWWYMRLSFRDDSKEGQKQYTSKYVNTELLATKENKPKAEKIMAEIIDSFSPLGSSTLVSTYCENWLGKKKSKLEATTFEGYQYKAKHIIKYFGDLGITIAELTPSHVEGFYNSLLESKSDSVKMHDEGLSNRSIKDIAVLFRAIIKDAYMLDYIKDERLAKKIMTYPYPKRPETPRERVYVSKNDMACFLAAIKGHCLENAYLITLFYGLRRSEVVGLKWSAIRNDRIYIGEHVVTQPGKPTPKDRPKTKSSRRNKPITPVVLDILGNIKKKQEENRALFGDSYFDSDYIFTKPDGHPYTPDYFTKQFRKIVDASEDLPKGLVLHDLRASCISIQINANVSPKAVQAWSGHSDFETMFNGYARYNKEEEKKIYELLTDVIFRAS